MKTFNFDVDFSLEVPYISSDSSFWYWYLVSFTLHFLFICARVIKHYPAKSIKQDYSGLRFIAVACLFSLYPMVFWLMHWRYNK